MCAKADHATERVIAHGLRIIDATNANIAFIAMLWHLSVLAICFQSRRSKDCIGALADHATERIIAHAAPLWSCRLQADQTLQGLHVCQG